MKRDEYLFIALVLFIISFFIQMIDNNRIYNEMIEVKKIAIEINEENNNNLVAIKSLNSHIDKMQHLDKLVQDLATIPRDKQSLILANCFNESNLKYDVKHKGKFDKTTKGICGVKSEWIKTIPGLNEDNINSLEAGYLVINYLEFEALKKYKGSINNLSPVNHTLQLKKAINENN